MQPYDKPLAKLDEPELLARAREHDEEAFKEIVRRLESRVAATTIGMLGPGPEAEDVGQETFVRFYRALDSFRGESTMASYVTRIAINLCQNARLRRKRQASLFVRQDPEQIYDMPGETSEVERFEERDFVGRALQQLNPDYRAVLVLRIMQGFSTRETAAILNIPEGTVTSRLARGQMKMKEIVEPYLKEAS